MTGITFSIVASAGRRENVKLVVVGWLIALNCRRLRRVSEVPLSVGVQDLGGNQGILSLASRRPPNSQVPGCHPRGPLFPCSNMRSGVRPEAVIQSLPT